MKAMPKTVYVKIEEDDGESYLVAVDDPEDLAAVGEKIRVGVYDLRVTSTLTAKPELA
jgi:hypothetical protein